MEAGGLGENGYMYMYDWVPSLFTWNYHKVGNQLYPKTKYKIEKKCIHSHYAGFLFS